MPTYEYECTECGNRFERFQSIKSEPLSECEKCNGPVHRLISAGGGLIFKGSGFYITDYRSESYNTQKKGDNGGSTSTATSDTAAKSSTVTSDAAAKSS